MQIKTTIRYHLTLVTEKAMAPHSSTLAWKIPWTEEPGGLQSMGSLRVGHDWATSLSRIGEGNGNPLQCSCLENPRDRGAWWAAGYGVAQSRTRLKRLSSSSSNKLEQVFALRSSNFTVKYTTDETLAHVYKKPRQKCLQQHWLKYWKTGNKLNLRQQKNGKINYGVFTQCENES